jgi:hypothetical protein
VIHDSVETHVAQCLHDFVHVVIAVIHEGFDEMRQRRAAGPACISRTPALFGLTRSSVNGKNTSKPRSGEVERHQERERGSYIALAVGFVGAISPSRMSRRFALTRMRPLHRGGATPASAGWKSP